MMMWDCVWVFTDVQVICQHMQRHTHTQSHSRSDQFIDLWRWAVSSVHKRLRINLSGRKECRKDRTSILDGFHITTNWQALLRFCTAMILIAFLSKGYSMAVRISQIYSIKFHKWYFQETFLRTSRGKTWFLNSVLEKYSKGRVHIRAATNTISQSDLVSQAQCWYGLLFPWAGMRYCSLESSGNLQESQSSWNSRYMTPTS